MSETTSRNAAGHKPSPRRARTLAVIGAALALACGFALAAQTSADAASVSPAATTHFAPGADSQDLAVNLANAVSHDEALAQYEPATADWTATQRVLTNQAAGRGEPIIAIFRNGGQYAAVESGFDRRSGNGWLVWGGHADSAPTKAAALAEAKETLGTYWHSRQALLVTPDITTQVALGANG